MRGTMSHKTLKKPLGLTTITSRKREDEVRRYRVDAWSTLVTRPVNAGGPNQVQLEIAEPNSIDLASAVGIIELNDQRIAVSGIWLLRNLNRIPRL